MSATLNTALCNPAAAADHQQQQVSAKGIDRSCSSQPADTFAGARPGFVFKLGLEGLGYYPDRAPSALPAEPAEPAGDASHAEPAEGASHAEPAEGASHAEPAEDASHAEPAEPAVPAEGASHAERAEPAEGASHAEPAEGASRAEAAMPSKSVQGKLTDSKEGNQSRTSPTAQPVFTSVGGAGSEEMGGSDTGGSWQHYWGQALQYLDCSVQVLRVCCCCRLGQHLHRLHSWLHFSAEPE